MAERTTMTASKPNLQYGHQFLLYQDEFLLYLLDINSEFSLHRVRIIPEDGLNLARRSSKERAWWKVRTMVLDVVNGNVCGIRPTELMVSLEN